MVHNLLSFSSETGEWWGTDLWRWAVRRNVVVCRRQPSMCPHGAAWLVLLWGSSWRWGWLAGVIPTLMQSLRQFIKMY